MSAPLGVSAPGGVCSLGVSALGGVCSMGVSVPGGALGGVCPRGCLLRGCLLWGVCLGGVCFQGVSARGCLLQGVSALGVSALGDVCSWGGLLWGGGIPACTEADTPRVNRMTDRCKNITLATTSLRPVTSIASTSAFDKSILIQKQMF